MSQDMVYETVPQLRRRVGDTVLAGQNNSTILLGRDRMAGPDTGYGNAPGAGAAHVIVGRMGEDPSPSDDKATLYLSARSDPDAMAGTAGIGQSTISASSAFVRADCVRIVPRQDIKISVGRAYLLMQSDGTVLIEGDVSLGKGAADRILKGDTFAAAYAAHLHPTPTGLSGPPTQPLPDAVFSQRNRVL